MALPIQQLSADSSFLACYNSWLKERSYNTQEIDNRNCFPFYDDQKAAANQNLPAFWEEIARIRSCINQANQGAGHHISVPDLCPSGFRNWSNTKRLRAFCDLTCNCVHSYAAANAFVLERQSAFNFRRPPQPQLQFDPQPFPKPEFQPKEENPSTKIYSCLNGGQPPLRIISGTEAEEQRTCQSNPPI